MPASAARSSRWRARSAGRRRWRTPASARAAPWPGAPSVADPHVERRMVGRVARIVRLAPRRRRARARAEQTSNTPTRMTADRIPVLDGACAASTAARGIIELDVSRVSRLPQRWPASSNASGGATCPSLAAATAPSCCRTGASTWSGSPAANRSIAGPQTRFVPRPLDPPALPSGRASIRASPPRLLGPPGSRARRQARAACGNRHRSRGRAPATASGPARAGRGAVRHRDRARRLARRRGRARSRRCVPRFGCSTRRERASRRSHAPSASASGSCAAASATRSGTGRRRSSACSGSSACSRRWRPGRVVRVARPPRRFRRLSDQAHMSRETRELSGLTPLELARTRELTAGRSA